MSDIQAVQTDSPGEITPPKIDHPVIEKPAPGYDGPIAETKTEAEALLPIKHDPVPAVPLAIVPAAPAPETTPKPVSLVISAEMVKQAESNVALYVWDHLLPSNLADKEALTKDLNVTLSNEPNKENSQHADVLLTFTGPAIGANYTLIKTEMERIFNEHPQFSNCMKAHHGKVDKPDKGPTDTLHVHLPNHTPQQYAELIHTLATGNSKAPNLVVAADEAKLSPRPPVNDDTEIHAETKKPVLLEPAQPTQKQEEATVDQAVSPASNLVTMPAIPKGKVIEPEHSLSPAA